MKIVAWRIPDGIAVLSVIHVATSEISDHDMYSRQVEAPTAAMRPARGVRAGNEMYLRGEQIKLLIFFAAPRSIWEAFRSLMVSR